MRTLKFKLIKIIKYLLFFSSFSLLILNISGFFISLRNNDIYSEPKNLFTNDITMTYKEALSSVDNAINNIDDDFLFVEQINTIVNKSIAHFWDLHGSSYGINKYNLRIPIYENYILYILSYFKPEAFLRYEIMNYRTALERGVGACSQHAIVFNEILRKRDVRSYILYLKGHVLNLVVFKDNTKWIADPDFGVILKTGLEDLYENSKVIRDSYEPVFKNRLNLKNVISLEELISFFGPEGNVIYLPEEYWGKKYYYEKVFYILKWAIPLFFLVLLFLILNLERKCKKCELQ